MTSNGATTFQVRAILADMQRFGISRTTMFSLIRLNQIESALARFSDQRRDRRPQEIKTVGEFLERYRQSIRKEEF